MIPNVPTPQAIESMTIYQAFGWLECILLDAGAVLGEGLQ